jgi:hypothetical protein
MGLAKGHQTTRKPVASDRLTGLHRECAALEATELAQHELGGRDAGKHAARPFQKKIAGFC